MVMTNDDDDDHCHPPRIASHRIASHRIASLLSPMGMCQYKGKVEEPPTTVALGRPLIFGALPDLLLILSSHTHSIQHTLLCTLEL